MAASDARPVPLKNTAYRHYFAIRKNDGKLITTWAGQDSELSADGAAFADATNEATEIGTSGVGYIDLTSGEMNYDCVVLKVTVTNTDALPYVVTLFPEESGDIRCDATKLGGTSQTGRDIGASVLLAADQAVNVTKVNGTAQTAGDLAALLTTIDGIVDNIVSRVVGTLAADTHNAQSGDSYAVVNSGTHGNAALKTLIDTVDDFVDTEVAAILAAVDTEVAAIKTKTDYLPSAAAGAAGGLFIAGSNAATTVNITGNLSGSVDSVTGAVGSVAAGGITAASIATGAVDADALAADAVDEILDEVIEGTVTLRQAIRLFRSALTGKASE